MAAAADKAAMAELADLCAQCLLDLPALAGLFEIKSKDKDAGPQLFTADRWHVEQWAFERDRTGRDIILKARQIGLTTLELLRDLQFSRLHKSTLTLIVIHDSELAADLFDVVRQMAERMVRLGLAPGLRFGNRREIVWSDNLSAVRVVEAGATIAAASKKGRSQTIHRLHATEVAYWAEAATTLGSLLNAVPATGEVCVESTANGVGNHFHLMVLRAIAGTLIGYRFHFWAWFQHDEYQRDPDPGFDARPQNDWERMLLERGCTLRQLAWWRWKVSELEGDKRGLGGLETALQDFPITPQSAFRARGGQYVPADACDAIDQAIRDPLEKRELVGPAGQLLGELWIYEHPIAAHSYVVPSDVADGGGCLSAAIAIDRRTGAHCAVFAEAHIDSGDLGHVLAQIGRLYNTALVAPERNVGGSTIRVLEKEERYPRIYSADDKEYGWVTSKYSRPIMWTELRAAIVKRERSTPDARLAAEVRALIRDETGRPGKGPGSTDDLFTAWAIGEQLMLRGAVGESRPVEQQGSEAKRAMGEATSARDLAF